MRVHSSRRARGSATFYIPEETFQNRIEIARAFPERRVPALGKAMTVSFPQVGIGKRVKVIELDEAILATVDHRKRNRVCLHNLPLINARSGTRRLEKRLAKATIRPRDSLVQERLGRFAEDRMDESLDVGLGQMLLPSQLHVRGTLEAVGHTVARHGGRADYHQAPHAGKARLHLDADMATQRPTEHNGLLHA